MNLTPQQRRGVEILDRSLLVSAAAGSGKTAVLAQRCAHIVCTGQDTAGPSCGVENLLVVTFTNAAAQQMRDRIGQRLREELEKAEGDSVRQAALRREIALLPRAHISTLSSFCADLVRRHFHAAGVDPNFIVLDEDQARLLKHQSARAVLDEQYLAEDADYVELIDLYAEGYDERLIGNLLRCHDLQTSLIDAARWRADSLAMIREAAHRSLNQNPLGQKMLKDIRREMNALVQWAQQIAQEAASLGLEKYAAHVHQCMLEPAEAWAQLAAAGDLAALSAAFGSYDKGRLPVIRGEQPGKQDIRQDIEAWKKLVTRGAMLVLLRFSDDDWRRSMQRVLAPTEQFLRLSERFEQHYQREKQSLRALDFADLEQGALRLLRAEGARPGESGPSEIALYYQRQFHHVLVDEFQDINQVQDRILRLISRESAPEEMRAAWRCNLFAVGDVKQSIYRFRLAEPGMFMDRARLARERNGDGLERIDLQMNFRSRGPLLEAINAVFRRLLTDEELLGIDYADAHELSENPDYGPVPSPGGFPGAPVELVVLEPPGAAAAEDEEPGDDDDAAPPADAPEDLREAERIEREATYIARRIQQFIEEGRVVIGREEKPEPLSFRHVCVLLRSRKFNSERFAGVLRKMGVPCFSEIGTGFFASLEVRDVQSLLCVLDNRRQDIPLAAVLRSPLVDLPGAADVLAKIRLEYPKKYVPFHEAVVRYARQKGDAIAARLRDVLDQLEKWRRLAHRRPVAELLWQIYEDSGYLAYAAGLHDGAQRTANLLELHRRAGQFDAFARQGLGAFMEFLKSLEETGEVGQPPILSEADDVVRVMSIHASKGLEFPVVFLADCGKEHNLQDTWGSILLDRRLGVAMQAVDRDKQVRYPSLVHELARRDIWRESIAEELRVLYVAMTRAREHLACVGTAKKSAARDLERWRRDASTAPLLPQEVLRGRSYLEWLGRASSGASAARERLFDVQIVEAGDIDTEAGRYSGRARPSRVPESLAALEPLDSPPQIDQRMRATAELLIQRYPYEAVTRLRAAVGVTSLDARGAIDEQAPPLPSSDKAGGEDEPANPWRIAATDLRPPAFLEAAGAPAADEIGTATHIVLRLLDFREAGGAPEVRRQVESMVERRQISVALARHVDLEAISWLASTELGRLLAAGNDRLLRELPVRVPADARVVQPEWDGQADGPLDRVLLRGQIDVVIPLPEGLVIADYKTDRFPGIAAAPGSPARHKAEAAIQETVARYRAQIEHYRRALEQVSGRTVSAAWLVLLGARRIERL